MVLDRMCNHALCYREELKYFFIHILTNQAPFPGCILHFLHFQAPLYLIISLIQRFRLALTTGNVQVKCRNLSQRLFYQRFQGQDDRWKSNIMMEIHWLHAGSSPESALYSSFLTIHRFDMDKCHLSHRMLLRSAGLKSRMKVSVLCRYTQCLSGPLSGVDKCLSLHKQHCVQSAHQRGEYMEKFVLFF